MNLVGNDDAFGVTPNDPGDGDTGPNQLLNAPTLVVAPIAPLGGHMVRISGNACAGCTVHLFEADRDPSGHGEASARFATVTADGLGAFATELALPLDVVVTAIAIDPLGNMSELAENVIAPRSLVVDNKSDDGARLACTTAANDCSLRGALSVMTHGDVLGFDAAVFTGVAPIQVLSSLPAVAATRVIVRGDVDTVIIDGAGAPATAATACASTCRTAASAASPCAASMATA